MQIWWPRPIHRCVYMHACMCVVCVLENGATGVQLPMWWRECQSLMAVTANRQPV